MPSLPRMASCKHEDEDLDGTDSSSSSSPRVPPAKIPLHASLTDIDQAMPKLADHGLPGGSEFLRADLCRDNIAPLIALLIWHGFLPMGTSKAKALLPKMHHNRCVLRTGSVHIGRKARKNAKQFNLTIDYAWDQVVSGVQQHTYTSRPGDCWLSSDLVSAYVAVNSLPLEQRRGSVTFHSVELWHRESGQLVAGEIGYTCGSVYTSCTGFALKEEFPGAGTVQLVVLARCLTSAGFVLWDLGMELDYKMELGAETICRPEWLRRIRHLRSANPVPVLQSPSSETEGLCTISGVPGKPATEILHGGAQQDAGVSVGTCAFDGGDESAAASGRPGHPNKRLRHATE